MNWVNYGLDTISLLIHSKVELRPAGTKHLSESLVEFVQSNSQVSACDWLHLRSVRQASMVI